MIRHVFAWRIAAGQKMMADAGTFVKSFENVDGWTPEAISELNLLTATPAGVRALHGKGLCLWRLGQTHAAHQVFALMLRLNPNDNQGVRFLIPDLDAGLTWEESMARDEQARASS